MTYVLEKPVPRREPELIQAEADRRWRGNTEKVATTSLDSITFRGVDISSRYQKAGELETMLAIVDSLPIPLCASIETIFCDSRATHAYSVVLKDWHKETARLVGERVDLAVGELNGGHNGINVKSRSGDQWFFVDPDWH
jgi:hypothetical protein